MAALPFHRTTDARRLLLLCAASALVHAMVLGALARSKPRELRALPAAALAVTLAPAPASERPASAPADTATATAPALVPPVALSERASGPHRANAAGAALLQAAPPAAGGAPPPSSLPGWDVGAGSDTSGPHQPGFQAVQTPPSARLDYAVNLQAAAEAPPSPAGSASLAWHSDDRGYRLALDGAASVLGELASNGQATDSGLAPLQARGADGAVIDFDWSASRARYAGSSDSVAISADAQDRASMLLRLSAIGLAAAGQFDAGIELQVAGSSGLATVRFENAGVEVIETALGPLHCIHLRQQTLPGQARLEVWLATERSWYPVQLRLVAADGSVRTQTVTRIAAE